MSALPRLKPCPECGRDDLLGVFTYESGASYVECSMECGYRSTACTTERWAVRYHNRERDERARVHMKLLKARVEAAEARAEHAAGAVKMLDRIMKAWEAGRDGDNVLAALGEEIDAIVSADRLAARASSSGEQTDE